MAIMDDMNIYTASWIIAGFFTTAACCLSLHLVYQHLTHYNEPRLQKYIVRILWMVPIYSLDSFISLKFYESSLLLDTFRDCYEAYVLYSFFSLLIAYLNGVETLEHELEIKPVFNHPFPLCFLPPIKPGRTFLAWCRRFVLQFVFVKPALSLFSLLLEYHDLYDDGSLSYQKGYLYVAILNNLSITFSLYFLVLFYIATEENLKPFHPFPKFLCIKSIIFFSFWQGIGIVTLVRLNFIVDSRVFTAGDIALFCQNFLICIEMFFLSLAHTRVFDYKQFCREGVEGGEESLESKTAASPSRNKTTILKNLQDVADVTDVIEDAHEVFKPIKDRLHSKDH